MVNKINLNDRLFKVSNFIMDKTFNEIYKQNQMIVGFDFKVTSEEYHEVATLLYKNDFTVSIPEKDLQFQATIQQYATSLTNLYEKNQVSDYHLVLIEKI